MQFGAQGGSGMFGGAGGFGGGGGMFGAKGTNASADKVKADGVKKVDAWLQELLPEDERATWHAGGKAPDGQETSTIVNQLACQEEDCPDDVVCVSTFPTRHTATTTLTTTSTRILHWRGGGGADCFAPRAVPSPA